MHSSGTKGLFSITLLYFMAPDLAQLRKHFLRGKSLCIPNYTLYVRQEHTNTALYSTRHNKVAFTFKKTTALKSPSSNTLMFIKTLASNTSNRNIRFCCNNYHRCTHLHDSYRITFTRNIIAC